MSKVLLEKEKFFDTFPGMSEGAEDSEKWKIRGYFDFYAEALDGVLVEASYLLEIHIPKNFPNELPKVWELEQKIPRDRKHHVNGDGSLCFGSPLRTLQKIHLKPTLIGFTENCLIPFLYVTKRQVLRGDGYISGELDHEEKGVIDDYLNIFQLKTKDQVMRVLKLLAIKKRLANKQKCPCDCGKRLGKCKLRLKINCFRNMASKSWFKAHGNEPGKAM